MEAIFATLTDEQRVETLNNVYQMGISTPVEKLAFSADKLVYLKPFIGRLLNSESVDDVSSKMMIRQVVDELLADIADEVSLNFSKSGVAKLKKAISDYGLGYLLNTETESTYNLRQVA